MITASPLTTPLLGLQNKCYYNVFLTHSWWLGEMFPRVTQADCDWWVENTETAGNAKVQYNKCVLLAKAHQPIPLVTVHLVFEHFCKMTFLFSKSINCHLKETMMGQRLVCTVYRLALLTVELMIMETALAASLSDGTCYSCPWVVDRKEIWAYQFSGHIRQ